MTLQDNVPLRDYIEQLIIEHDKRYEQRFKLMDEAVGKAERTMNERLNSMNEFRDALKDQGNRMATRVELDQVESQVQELRRAKANLDGRHAIISAAISTIVTIAMAIILHFITGAK